MILMTAHITLKHTKTTFYTKLSNPTPSNTSTKQTLILISQFKNLIFFFSLSLNYKLYCNNHSYISPKNPCSCQLLTFPHPIRSLQFSRFFFTIRVFFFFFLVAGYSSAVAAARRLPSDSGAFADWVGPPSAADELSLGFNSAADVPVARMWPSGSSRPIAGGYGHTAAPPSDMVGLMASGYGVGVSVLPLLTGLAPSSVGIEEGNWMISRGGDGGGGGGGVQFQGNNFDGFGFLGSGSGLNSGAGTCHDCGNQAKKDCSHRRCRSCCKSQGFDCATHVKSTWVPAARRRERQMLSANADAAATTAAGTSSGSTSGGKKPRLIPSTQTTTNSHTSTSNTPTRSFDTSSAADLSYKKAKKLPEQVRAPAVFKCVRVTAVEGGSGGGGNEYAYQAVVKIGGHVFKGYLYDHGVEARDGFPMFSDLHLGGGGDGGSTSSPIIDPVDVYGSSAARGGGLAGGSNYGNPIN